MESAEIDFVVERLREAPVFGAIGVDELAALAHEVEVVRVNAGATLAREGEDADGAYLLVSGRLRAFVTQADDSEMAVGEIAAGELVGEMSMLVDAPRSASVKAVRDSQLFFIKSTTFNRIIHTKPEATLAIARVLVSRLERANAGRQGAPPRRAIAVVPTFGDCTKTIDALLTTVGSMKDSQIVRSETVAASLGPDHSEAELLHWLHRLEAKAPLVIYVADGDHESPWTHRCMRQADHIVAIDAAAGAARDERIFEILEAMTVGSVGPTVDAVCVHPTNARRGSGGSRWVQNNHIRAHHIRQGAQRDLERVSRAILQRDVGLVLSGGGARGMAHVGVIRALDEANVPIDVVGGTSFGAIVAVMKALDFTWREMRDILWSQLAKPGAPIDVTPPSLAFSKGRRLTALLSNSFDDATLEDAWLRCFCVSSNLSTGHPLVHSTGNAAAALRASVAIPGVFPPVASGDGEVLVDGAVMNNLPVDVMDSFHSGGPIIAVNLRAPASIAAGDLPEDGVVSGWGLLYRRLHPFRAAAMVPGLMEILTRSNEVAGAEATRSLERSADLVLRPPTGDHALLEFGAVDDLIATGYAHTVTEIESWRTAGTLPI